MKHKLMMLILLSLLMVISSCYQVPSYKDIYDKDDQIVLQGDSYTYQSRIGEVEELQANLEFSRFTGSETIFTFSSKVMLTVTINENITKGRFKILLMDSTSIITELEDQMSVNLDNLSYRIKIVGDDASGAFEMSLSFE